MNLSKEVSKYINATIPRQMWHYTTLEGLEGILSSGRMRATEARYTNDKEEYVFAKGVALKYFRSIHPVNELPYHAIETLDNFVNNSYDAGVYSRKFANVFIASFSAAKDLDSQWIKYGNEYKGVSLCFDLTGIRPRNEPDTTVIFVPCCYCENQQKDLIRASVDEYMTLAEKADLYLRNERLIQISLAKINSADDPAAFPIEFVENSKKIDKRIRKCEQTLINDLFLLSGIFKNSTFKSEDEWRLVFPISNGGGSSRYPIGSRHKQWDGEDVYAPFVDLKLDKDSERLPITQVMIGPKSDYQHVREILKKYKYEINIVSSSNSAR